METDNIYLEKLAYIIKTGRRVGSSVIYSPPFPIMSKPRLKQLQKKNKKYLEQVIREE